MAFFRRRAARRDARGFDCFGSIVRRAAPGKVFERRGSKVVSSAIA
jgi:hypothetical protein